MLMLRQIEAQSSALRSAYLRLEEAISGKATESLDTVILDWLEGELKSLRRQGADTSEIGPALLSQTLALCRALKG